MPLRPVSRPLADAGLDFAAMPEAERYDIGVIWGTGNGGISTFEQQLKEFNSGDGTPRFNPYFIPKMIVDIAAGVISMRYQLHGPNYCTVSACASSNTAIISAFDTIRMGKATVMIAGGSEAAITPASVGGFSAAQALSKQNDTPATASKPFDRDRDGFVMGEGAGALVLEELEHALARGATIHAELAGGGMAGDAYHLTGTHPEGLGAMLGIQRALRDAGIEAEAIDYINAHATSTGIGDLSELVGIKRVFGDTPRTHQCHQVHDGTPAGRRRCRGKYHQYSVGQTRYHSGYHQCHHLDERIPEGMNMIREKRFPKK